MKKHCLHILLLLCMLFLTGSVLAQGARKKVKEGNELYKQENYVEALTKYRDAELDDPQSPIVQYDIGNALYKTKEYEEAMKAYEKALTSPDAKMHGKSYYNMGNSLFRLEKLPESIMAYKKALEANPEDYNAKHNLEIARNKLKQQQQQQQQNQDQQDKNQKNEEQEQQQQAGEGEQDEQQQQQQQNQEEGEEQEKQQPKPREQEMTREEAERILNALKNDEKDLQEKRMVKAKSIRRVKKDW